MHAEIEFIYGGYNILDRIAPLWEKLNRHHYENAKNEKSRFLSFTFGKRKEMFSRKGQFNEFLVIIACDKISGRDIGYCISTVGIEEGEIESLFVDADYRGRKIGSYLLEKSLKWIEKRGAEKISIKVAEGNEEAFDFYKKYGFFLRSYNLKIKKGR